MKLTIERLKIRDIVTLKGDSQMINFRAGGGVVLVIRGEWNAHWKNGSVIDVAPDQIKINEKEGKTFTNIRAPKTQPQVESVSGTSNGAAGTANDRVLNGLIAIHKDLKLIKKQLGITDEKCEKSYSA